MTQRKRTTENPSISRRDAIRRIASGSLTAALAGCLPNTIAAQSQDARQPAASDREFLFFSKPFQSLSFDALGELAAQAGYTGLEFPVRPGGHVEPFAVEEQLPQAIEAFREHGITVPLISTGINEVSDEQATERVLRTAAELGIPRFRMAYYRYDLKQPIAPQLDAFAPKLDALVALADKTGIKPLYQNHSGLRYVGAPVWDIYSLIKGHSPDKIGLAFDIGHAIVEGTKCWPLHFALVQDYLDIAYIKDPQWNAASSSFGWAPLGTGLIPSEYYGMLEKAGFAGPLSIHVEYLDHKDPANHARFRDAIRDDLAALRERVR
jgi:sugar phosphate isomerase/epimerase